MKLLDYLLGPRRRFQCDHGHVFWMRGKHLASFQPCPDCHLTATETSQ